MSFARMPAALGSLVVLLLASGCKTTGDYVWADDLPRSPAPVATEYVIQPGDTITVRVWGQEAISPRSRVRPDGRISMPFLNDVEAAGSTPSALAARIQARLKDYIVNPMVTVSVEDLRPQQVSVIGEVARPGSFPVEQGGAPVLQVLAQAGGMTPFADKDRIMVIRQKPDGSGAQRIRFTYSSLTQLEGRAATFRLQGGDVVVVE